MEELVMQLRAERAKTGRNVREILDSMIDEGYVQLTMDEISECLQLADANQ